MNLSRRAWIASLSGVVPALPARTHTVLLRSGWQTVNIGDIAHTPGVLAVLERHLPGARLILWPASIDRGKEPMLRRRFPKLQIVKGSIGPNGEPDTGELRDAFQQAALLIHGSAASISQQSQIEAWRSITRKPYGFFGVGFTFGGEAAGVALNEGLRSIVSGAAFLFTRETASLANVRKANLTGPETGFAPDGTFSMDILDEERARAFLKRSGLEPGRFLCVVPRLRYTPYHLIRKVAWDETETRRRTEVNDRHAEPDHAKLREAAIAFVRKTGGKVLLCPEMTYAIDIIDPLLYDPLPADVKPHVVRRKEFWLPDEAAAVYKRAVCVLSCECHSPILAAANGTPCIYAHQPEDGIKGQMWKDIGLGDWYFDIEETTGAAIASRVLGIAADAAGSRRKVREAVRFARRAQAERMAFVRSSVLAR